ncbi:hypothetical protein LEP1GSC179_3574 [Leptospira santarosai str. MOR084]|uniref:Uncharacterized protein n=1 Tax=Leptospira santarosai str. MOR084 TaxID=1049984 RepID=A0A0E2BB71_9LEPT|nr:hypothetical protein LEP1GSC179_3574 [Leptospira santarosai str. MOR084]
MRDYKEGESLCPQSSVFKPTKFQLSNFDSNTNSENLHLTNRLNKDR